MSDHKLIDERVEELTVVEMQVAAADGASGDFNNHILVVDDLWFGSVHCLLSELILCLFLSV